MSDFKFAVRLSLTFFTISTILMAIYFFTLSPISEQIGYAYTGIAMLIGMIYLILLGFKVVSKKLTTTEGIKCAGVLLFNLPIAALYFYFVVVLMTTARITFENTTGSDISALSLGGCHEQEIGDLKTGESKTVWVRIKSDCSLVLFYKLNREPKLETAFPSLIHNEGLIATYKIGSK